MNNPSDTLAATAAMVSTVNSSHAPGLRPVVDRVFPFAEAQHDLAALEGQRQRLDIGRIRQHIDAQAVLLGGLGGSRPDARDDAGSVRLTSDADQVAHGAARGEPTAGPVEC